MKRPPPLIAVLLILLGFARCSKSGDGTPHDMATAVTMDLSAMVPADMLMSPDLSASTHDMSMPTDGATSSDMSLPDLFSSDMACPGGKTFCGGSCVTLNTDSNCGACGRSCYGNGCNSDGTCNCKSLYSPSPEPADGLLAGSNLYLMLPDNEGTPSLYFLWRVPTDGSPAALLASDGSSAASGVTTDGTKIYWATLKSGTSTMWSLPLGASSGTSPSSVFSPVTIPGWNHLRIQNGYFYWVTNTAAAQGTGVYARSLTATASDHGSQIVTDNVYSVFDVTDIAFFYNNTSSLRTAAIGGGAPATVGGAVIDDLTPQFAVDGHDIYWTSDTTSSGVYHYIAGPSPTPTPAGGSVVPVAGPSASLYGSYGLILADDNMYFAVASTTNRIFRVAKTGGTYTAIDNVDTYAVRAFLGVDANFLYYRSFAGAPVVQCPR